MIDNRQNMFNTVHLEELIDLVVGKSVELEGIKEEYQVSIILVDNKQIQELNRDYRRLDLPTDVLSFPMLDYDTSGYDCNTSHGDSNVVDLDTGELVLGDIAISLERAFEQSREYGHSFEREVGYLTAHGMLHLLGYDHEGENERTIMRLREEEILGCLNINRYDPEV
jgi:probable rRNA maturation factor